MTIRRLSTRFPLAALVLLCASLTGCGTLITLIDGPKGFDEKEIAYPYSGTRFSVGGVRKTEGTVALVFVVDVPLSFVGDTVVLPIRLVQEGYTLLFGREAPEEVLEPEST